MDLRRLAKSSRDKDLDIRQNRPVDLKFERRDLIEPFPESESQTSRVFRSHERRSQRRERGEREKKTWASL